MRPWGEPVLRWHGVRSLFDSPVVSGDIERPNLHPREYHRRMDGADGEVVMVSDEYDEDPLMAQCFGTTTVWVESTHEIPHREPGGTTDALPSLPPVLDEVLET